MDRAGNSIFEKVGFCGDSGGSGFQRNGFSDDPMIDFDQKSYILSESGNPVPDPKENQLPDLYENPSYRKSHLS